jgi:hypothetical protein
MEQQQSFSHGLLYSVAPQNFAELHLHDEAKLDGFDWEEYEAQFAGDSFTQVAIEFLKITAAKWGYVKP